MHQDPALIRANLEQKIKNHHNALGQLYKRHFRLVHEDNTFRKTEKFKEGGKRMIRTSAPIPLSPERPQVKRLEKQIDEKVSKIEKLEAELASVG